MTSPPIEYEPTQRERTKPAHDKPENVAVETRSAVQSVAETMPFEHPIENLAETNPLSEVSIYERMRSAKPLNPGDFLGQGQAYRITKRIGRGGMGETFLADEMENGEVVWEVVCKIVPPEIQNLEQEILAVRRTFLRVHKLNHTNICPIRGLKFDDTYGWFLIMGYANGGSLTQYLAKHPDFSHGKGIPFTEALKILTPIAKALDYIHEEGVFHRDIKPDNVMFVVNKQTKRMTVQVIDFGLSAQLQQSNLQAGTIQANAISGTPHYMAPEQWLGKQQCRQTDQYALGVMTYRLLSRKMPFKAANTQALMSQVLTIPATEIEGQPAHINAAILKALSKEPAQRFPRCIDFIRALQTVPTADPLVSVPGDQDFEVSLITAVEGQNDANTVQQVRRSVSMTGGDMTMLPYISQVSEPVISAVPHAAEDTHKVMIQALAAIVIALVVGMIYLLVASSYSTPSVSVAVAAPEPVVAEPESVVPVPEPVVTESVPPVSAAVPEPVVPLPPVVEPETPVFAPQPVVSVPSTAAQVIPSTLVVSQTVPITYWQDGNKAGERKTVTINDVEYAFRWCPPGTFMMGSPESETGRGSNETHHQVTLTTGFWMLGTEVTQEMWESVMGTNPSKFKGKKLPVENVSWDDCQEFIEKSNEIIAGMKGVLARNDGTWRFSLPTEAQWEYACRAGTTNTYGGTGNLEDMGWYGSNSGRRTHTVGTKKTNVWGLYDMHGNVWEWCQDRYGDYLGGSVTDPFRSYQGTYRILRGGSWGDGARYCRSSYRGGDGPTYWRGNLGFRLSLVGE